MSNIYLVSVEDVKNRCVIDENISDKIIKNIIQDVQDTIIENILGTSLFEKMLSNNLTTNYKTLGKKYLQPIIIKEVELRLLDELAIKISNNGVTQNNGTNYSNAELKAVINKKKSVQEVSDNYKLKLQRFLNANTSIYPEYLIDSPILDSNANDAAFDTMLYFDEWIDYEEPATKTNSVTTLPENEVVISYDESERKDYYFLQGDDINFSIDIDTDITSTPTLTDNVEIGYIVYDYNDNEKLVFKYTASGSTSLTIDNDKLIFYKAKTETDVIELQAGSYYYVFYIVDTSNISKTFLKGKFIYKSKQTV